MPVQYQKRSRMYRWLRSLSMEILVAFSYAIVAILATINFMLEFEESSLLSNFLRGVIIIVLVVVSFLLIKKDADKKQ